jgi:ADP-heptose:LPS heptosyltransferase
MSAPRKVLFVIRGKLGDTLVLFMAVRRYVEQFPHDSVTLLIRKDYARLLAAEPGLRIIAFGSRLEMIARLAWLRLRREAFDILAVLWGFGPPIRLVARLVSANRKIYLDGRFSDLYPEWPNLPPLVTLVDPAMQVIHCFEPRLECPDRLHLPGLAALRAPDGKAIGVVPIADEVRRNFDPATLLKLIKEVSARHPGSPIRVFVNPVNTGVDAILNTHLPGGVELRKFSSLMDLLEEYRFLTDWYGTDTGLYHLAAAMGIHATVFFGPTQPWKIVMPGQPQATWVRLQVLGRDHCEEKACSRPVCLHEAVASFSKSPSSVSLEGVPPACPLRAHAVEALPTISLHENPSHQA